jgi:hypothetical protein
MYSENRFWRNKNNGHESGGFGCLGEVLCVHFPTTVHIEGYMSWYKAGLDGRRLVGLWHGSSLHALKALS